MASPLTARSYSEICSGGGFNFFFILESLGPIDPRGSSVPIALPPGLYADFLKIILKNCVQAFGVFKNFYLAKHSGRILTLQPSAGTADLNSLFYSGKKGGEEEEVTDQDTQRNVKKHILCVNTYQMVILLMFNTRERLSYEEIKAVNIFINTQNKVKGWPEA